MKDVLIYIIVLLAELALGLGLVFLCLEVLHLQLPKWLAVVVMLIPLIVIDGVKWVRNK